MDVSPTISVVIPVYNPGKHLRKCLDSLLAQTYRNLQIILIDDGSTDGSGSVCDDYAVRDHRVICRHQANQGVSSARNHGLALAQGDYIHFPDSDDYLEPDTYEYLLQLIETHQCDAVNFEYYVTWPSHEQQHLLAEDKYGLKDTEGAHEVLLNGEPFAWNKLFARKLVTGMAIAWNKDNPECLSFREDIYRGEDSLFAHQALDRASRVWFDQRPLYHYVQSEESAVRGKFRVSQLSAMKLYEAYQPLYGGKYPKLYAIFLSNMSHLMISLYYDMWADKENYTKQQKEVFQAFQEHYSELLALQAPKGKAKFKFSLFAFSPWLFCLLHRINQ